MRIICEVMPALMPRPLPPCFAWSPFPASRGRMKSGRARLIAPLRLWCGVWPQRKRHVCCESREPARSPRSAAAAGCVLDEHGLACRHRTGGDCKAGRHRARRPARIVGSADHRICRRRGRPACACSGAHRREFADCDRTGARCRSGRCHRSADRRRTASGCGGRGGALPASWRAIRGRRASAEPGFRRLLRARQRQYCRWRHDRDRACREKRRRPSPAHRASILC